MIIRKNFRTTTLKFSERVHLKIRDRDMSRLSFFFNSLSLSLSLSLTLFLFLSLSLLVERSDADDDYRKIVDHVLIDVMKRVFE